MVPICLPRLVLLPPGTPYIDISIPPQLPIEMDGRELPERKRRLHLHQYNGVILAALDESSDTWYVAGSRQEYQAALVDLIVERGR